jgi:hypothetical protein
MNDVHRRYPNDRRVTLGAPLRRCGVVVGLLAVLACGDPSHTATRAAADVQVTVRTAAIVAPDSVSPGWRRVHVDETDGAHIVVVFRMPATTTTDDVAAFVSALDTAPATPLPGVALGGPEVGARGDVIVHLTPGVYVLACVRRGEDGHRHARSGEYRVLHARSAEAADSVFAAPPAVTQEVRLVDFAYVGPDHWAPGVQVLRIENTGRQDHQVRLARLRDGASLQAWMMSDDPDTVATAIAGMARVGPGQVAYLPVTLPPGRYVLSCLVADLRTKRPHVELGMVREIYVP